VYLLHWRELTDASLWRQGWLWREAVPGVCCLGPRTGAVDPDPTPARRTPQRPQGKLRNERVACFKREHAEARAALGTAW